jgi:hypothetical protein
VLYGNEILRDAAKAPEESPRGISFEMAKEVFDDPNP